MFRRSNESGADAAKRMARSFLETSGLVCGSLKDTITDEDNIQWIGKGVDNIKSKLEGPRKQIFSQTEKICHGGETLSPMSQESVGSDIFEETDRALGINTRPVASSIGESDKTAADTRFLQRTAPNQKGNTDDRAQIREIKSQSNYNDGYSGGESAGGGSHNIVIGLCLSRRHETLGHPGTVTRQTAFDFNELQDRNYKYVSSTDRSGWLAGGGEKGDTSSGRDGGSSSAECDHAESIAASKSEDSDGNGGKFFGRRNKTPGADKVHIPIIRIDADSAATVDSIISAIAAGDVFIPHMSILPEALSVSGTSPPDLVVRFGCEKNDDVNPEEWPNWCLEFLHNQLYDCFASFGAKWTKRPFQITLARKVRWKTVKHMNKYFSQSEQVINSWREKGPQYLQPPFSNSTFGATHEEVTRPHGIYLLRNGVPTNYFAPNFNPPYTTKMTRSLIRNVVNKSWDVKRRDWRTDPVPRMRTPALIVNTVMGCALPKQQTLSPVESGHKVIPMMTGYESIQADRDAGARLSTYEEHGERDKKKTVINSEVHESEHTHQHARIDKKPDPSPISLPSDDSSNHSTQPDGPYSVAESTAEPVSDIPTEFSGTESPIKISNFDFDIMQSSGQVSSKGVSFSLEEKSASSFNENNEVAEVPSQPSSPRSSFADPEMERKIEGEREREIERQKIVELDRPAHDTHVRTIDSKAEKYARTKSKRRELRDRRQDDNAERGIHGSKNSPGRLPTGQNGYNLPSPSAESTSMSLAYSVDSASLLRGINHINTKDDGGSVITMGTENQSLLSYVTRSTMLHSRYDHHDNDGEEDYTEADDISLSLLESKSSRIPNDDELLAIGWAKALDPHSGSYYYFTLDRSKIVWENPLE
mmetsp:Transcript_22336/g.42305  ORF Transcript_22336/g.42305 Transcript_22336/m.42305 type:complete len:874 (-) Transcript_22336:243-2864(-)